MKPHYVEITKDEFYDIIDAGYEYPSVYVDGNGYCWCEELLYDMYESNILQLCEMI